MTRFTERHGMNSNYGEGNGPEDFSAEIVVRRHEDGVSVNVKGTIDDIGFLMANLLNEVVRTVGLDKEMFLNFVYYVSNEIQENKEGEN